MKLELTEKDYELALGKEFVLTRIKGKGKVLGPGSGKPPVDQTQAVLDAMPKALVARIGKLLPKDMILWEIRLNLSVEGKPFGVGIGGEAEVTLRRSDASRSDG